MESTHFIEDLWRTDMTIVHQMSMLLFLECFGWVHSQIMKLRNFDLSSLLDSRSMHTLPKCVTLIFESSPYWILQGPSTHSFEWCIYKILKQCVADFQKKMPAILKRIEMHPNELKEINLQACCLSWRILQINTEKRQCSVHQTGWSPYLEGALKSDLKLFVSVLVIMAFHFLFYLCCRNWLLDLTQAKLMPYY